MFDWRWMKLGTWRVATKIHGKLVSWKDATATIQSMIAVLAFFTAGYWTYTNFIEQRQDHPRLNISHKISHLVLPNGTRLLTVDEIYSNPGPVLLKIEKGDIRVVRVLPLPQIVNAWADTALSKAEDFEAIRALNDEYKNSQDDIKTWPLLALRPLGRTGSKTFVIEPGENDQLHNEFIIPTDVQVVSVMTYIYNPSARNINVGWRAISMYDFRANPPKQ